MPVAEFYDIRPHSRTLGPAGWPLVTLPVVDAHGQIKCNEREAGLSFRLIFEAKDMLVPLRARFELQSMMAVDVLVIDLDMTVTAIV